LNRYKEATRGAQLPRRLRHGDYFATRLPNMLFMMQYDNSR